MRRGGTATESATTEKERRLGRYRLLDLIGRDGDARLHRALDANGQTVELWTVPLARLCADAAGVERFRQMATAAARLSHPAIPAVLASGEHAGTAFVATLPVEGRTLAARLDDGPLPWDEAVATLDRALDALSAAHRAGVVHGALTADTIRHSGSAAVVGGFGRAALTAARADRKDDLEAAARLTGRILAGHEDRPAVATLLADLRDGGSFPDVASLHIAVSGLTGAPRPRAVAPVRSTRRPLWAGGVVLAGGVVAAVTILNWPSPPRTVADSPATKSAAVTPLTPPPAATPAAPPSAPPSPSAASRQPPVAEIAQALRTIPCALVTVEKTGGRLLVSGTVAGERAETEVRETVEALAAGWDHGFDLANADAQFCAPLGSVATALDANRGLAEPLAAQVLEGPDLSAGDLLVLEIRAPARPVQVQVDYFTIDGSVVHLLPNPSDSGAALAAGASRRLGEKAGGDKATDGKPQSGRYWTIGPPFGTEMLLTIATAMPLFPTPRPEQEPAADYLAALSDALATIPDDAPAPLADAQFIATGP
ncbi:serine/threonine protein kinase [Azospirillum sp. A1-3]|uniref:serine/threonine protein kinase n=1 Tax=Azospirillum sp. A1-3 TaxID=185874 RepID=UPI0020771FB3|nr:serine/threonine protein kinase [Azospirillum sp. A1-3]MCM8736314.1 serine/threonine protein kinase [Azospirillum sp. A1-3]